MRPKSVFLMLPSGDGRYEGLLMRGVLQVVCAGWNVEIYYYNYCSNIKRVRDDCLHAFMQSTHDWAVFVDDDTGFTLEDWCYLWEGDELAVTATCVKKRQDRVELAQFGLAFCRISRAMLMAIGELELEGRPRALRYRKGGHEQIEYCPMGAHVVDYSDVAEDHGFWLLAQLTGLPVRLEERCRLVHVGSARWHTGEDDPLHPKRTDLTEA